ncbi:MAG: 23S rRNA (uracil(1939)-C(5))-methyltransferase RlmD [Clostridia bacterium]|nr:23S rRNA (uracil(1939)-C(5))-methyltransferase RlmD [Clostridia bacterium]
MLTKNQLISLQIAELNHLGFGVAKHDGMLVFFSCAVEGDVVEARIIKVDKTYAIAKTEAIKEPSPFRIEPMCKTASCGGCVYGSVSLARENEVKKEGVRAAFRRAGICDAEIEDTVFVGERYHYRNKAQYPVSKDKNGAVKIGFFAPKSHRVVEAAGCPLQPRELSLILETVREFLVKYDISIYDEANKEGLVRHICLRKGTVSGEISLCIVICGNALPHSDKLIDAITASHKEVVGIEINCNLKDTNVIYGDTFRVLWGRGHIYDTLCGVTLRLATPAFYQVNHAATERLYAIAKEKAELKGDELLLDLFCGVGSIGLSMADKAGEVIGVEIIPEAVECANENARQNGIKNAAFYCADANDPKALLSQAQEKRGAPIRPDVVVLDPPRKGCAAALLSYLADSLSPEKIVYISCNPETLARDAKLLVSLGYEMSAVTPVNLFPLTHHVESVVCLTRDLL